jgi:hypothetical protein
MFTCQNVHWPFSQKDIGQHKHVQINLSKMALWLSWMVGKNYHKGDFLNYIYIYIYIIIIIL